MQHITLWSLLKLVIPPILRSDPSTTLLLKGLNFFSAKSDILLWQYNTVNSWKNEELESFTLDYLKTTVKTFQLKRILSNIGLPNIKLAKLFISPTTLSKYIHVHTVISDKKYRNINLRLMLRTCTIVRNDFIEWIVAFWCLIGRNIRNLGILLFSRINSVSLVPAWIGWKMF